MNGKTKAAQATVKRECIIRGKFQLFIVNIHEQQQEKYN